MRKYLWSKVQFVQMYKCIVGVDPAFGANILSILDRRRLYYIGVRQVMSWWYKSISVAPVYLRLSWINTWYTISYNSQNVLDSSWLSLIVINSKRSRDMIGHPPTERRIGTLLCWCRDKISNNQKTVLNTFSIKSALTFVPIDNM